VTVSVADPVRLPTFALIFTVPSFTPVAKPDALTVAIVDFGGGGDHDAVDVRSFTLPSL